MIKVVLIFFIVLYIIVAIFGSLTWLFSMGASILPMLLFIPIFYGIWKYTCKNNACIDK